MKPRLPILAALAFLIASAAIPEEDLRSRLKAELPRLIQAGEIPGASMAVIRDGQVYWTGAAGVIAPGSTTPVRTDTVFSAASLTKPVFAYLADRGVIDLDAPLAGYLPYPRVEHDERHRKITARMVLSHTTGLPNWALGQDHIPFQFAPDEAWGYSGEGFVYLQKAIEKLTGTPLADLARREVFDPLGMTRSRLAWDPALEGQTVSGVNAQGRVEPLPRRTESNAAASLLTTAEDYARFLVAFLEGRGLKPESRKAMLEPRMQVQSKWGEPKSPKQPGVFWGLGWGLEQAEGVDTFWHWGHEEFWRAFVVVRRDGKAGLVYFANSYEGLSIAEALSDLAIGGPRLGLAWLGEYEQHDDPRRAARKEIDRAFREGGIEAGARRYRELRKDRKLAETLADQMMEQTRDKEAVALLRAALETEPNAAGLHSRLGQALMGTGELQAALAEYETAAKLDPENQWPGIRKWLREGIDAKPATVPEETLRRLAGVYGPRTVTLEGGSLHYQREGRPKYRLIPIGPTLFAVEGNGSFRVRFAEDGSRLAVLQPDGEDESARTPSAPPPRP